MSCLKEGSYSCEIKQSPLDDDTTMRKIASLVTSERDKKNS